MCVCGGETGQVCCHGIIQVSFVQNGWSFRPESLGQNSCRVWASPWLRSGLCWGAGTLLVLLPHKQVKGEEMQHDVLVKKRQRNPPQAISTKLFCTNRRLLLQHGRHGSKQALPHLPFGWTSHGVSEAGRGRSTHSSCDLPGGTDRRRIVIYGSISLVIHCRLARVLGPANEANTNLQAESLFLDIFFSQLNYICFKEKLAKLGVSSRTL